MTVMQGEVTPQMIASYKGEKIPTLEEALLLVKSLDWKVNVEIKDHISNIGHESIAGDVCDMIRRLGMAESTILSSFQHEYLRQAAALLPEMPRAALVTEPRPQDAAAVCRDAAAVYYHPKHTLVLPDDVQTLRAQGILINVWTANSPDDMERAISLGVNAIITDYPRRLREMLSR